MVGGTPYQIIGYVQSVNDFSTVVFPQNIERCTACHAGAQGDALEDRAGQADVHVVPRQHRRSYSPCRRAWSLHGGGPQPDNATCAVCHPASGGLAGIADKHFTGLLAPTATTVALTIQSITNTAPGQIADDDVHRVGQRRAGRSHRPRR